MEEHEKEQKVYIPKSFTIDKRVKLIEEIYILNGKDVITREYPKVCVNLQADVR